MALKGHIPWNKGTKGLCKLNKTSFKKGHKLNIGITRSDNYKKNLALQKFKIIISKEKLDELYFNKRLSQLKIAKLYNIKMTTISRLMKFYGMKPRSLSEAVRIRYEDSGAREKERIKMKLNNPMDNIIYREKVSISKRGEKNPSWLGGISFEPYTPEFNNELKEQIRKRDDYTCQECSYTEEQLKYKLIIHHINYNKKNNKPNNLISLCRNCHSQTNFERENWIDYFMEKIKIGGEKCQ